MNGAGEPVTRTGTDSDEQRVVGERRAAAHVHQRLVMPDGLERADVQLGAMIGGDFRQCKPAGLGQPERLGHRQGAVDEVFARGNQVDFDKAVKQIAQRDQRLNRRHPTAGYHHAGAPSGDGRIDCLRHRPSPLPASRSPADRSSLSRYGARYLAAIFVGGDHGGVSLIVELNPWPPVM